MPQATTGRESYTVNISSRTLLASKNSSSCTCGLALWTPNINKFINSFHQALLIFKGDHGSFFFSVWVTTGFVHSTTNYPLSRIYVLITGLFITKVLSFLATSHLARRMPFFQFFPYLFSTTGSTTAMESSSR